MTSPTADLIGMGRVPSPAARFVDTRQRIGLLLMLAVVAAGFATRPMMTAIALIWATVVCYGGLLGFKATLVHQAWRLSERLGLEPATVAQPPTGAAGADNLPSYTILVPLFHEAEVVEPLVAHLSRMDYPPHRLEVLLLCEHDDLDTLQALRSLSLPFNYRLVVCPPGAPRTKPRACNIGLAQARGRYVVVYDAEDRPDLDQLHKAAACFAAADDTTVCLQARLDYHNHAHNWLTRLFTLEYNFWFDLLLPALVRRDLPIPLGGTSNHFRTRTLRALGGWDAYNVTEDADLGIRLYTNGYRTQMLDSITQEEACAQLGPWVRQRTRWLKGYLQTWAVATRTNAVWRRGGLRGGLALHLLLGATPIVTILNPVFWAANLYYALTRDHRMLAFFPRPLLYASLGVFLIGNFLFFYTNLLGLVHRRRWHLLTAAFMTPLYWLMMSVAGVRAAAQVVTSLHVWEKTPHGLTGAATDPAIVRRRATQTV